MLRSNHDRKAGLFLVCLAFLAIVAATLAACGKTSSPGAGQPDLAREVAVKANIYNLQTAIQSYAAENNGAYPPTATQTTLVNASGQSYIDSWPNNPYTNAPMAPGTGPGDYSYTTNGTSFQLIGYGKDGKVVVTAP